MTCKTHPDAPHGFDRNGSHSEDRYVCECESWEPPQPHALVLADRMDCVTDDDCGECTPCCVAAELRRLHAENEALRTELAEEHGLRMRLLNANDDTALLRQALERLEIWMDEHGCQRDRETITAIRARLNFTEKS